MDIMNQNTTMSTEEFQKRIFQFKHDPYINGMLQYISKLYAIAPTVIMFKYIDAEKQLNEMVFDASDLISHDLAESPMKERINKMLADVDYYKAKHYPDLFPTEMKYKGWVIEPFDFKGYSALNDTKFQAWNESDNEIPMLTDATIDGIKVQIDEIES